MDDKCKKEMQSISIQGAMSKSDPGMDEVITSLKEYVLKVMRESHNANPQEIATLPWLLKTLSEYYKES